MSSPHHRHARVRALATVSTLGLTAGLASILVSAPAQAAPVNLTVLTFNDFHGRIDSNTTKFATTIEDLRLANGEDNTLVVSGGDNISASLFASAYAEDEPTVEVLNALDLPVSAVGNHEFDRGWDWLKSHLIDGTVADYTPAEFKLLGANVYSKSTGNPALDDSYRITKAGVDICVTGAVTKDTPSLVSPDGVATLDFKAPVAEINRAAEAMEASAPCDVTIATYHEGAPYGTQTLEENVAASPAFADIVNNTSPLVDVIITGHTHQAYAWTAAKPGGGQRPVIEAGSYGSHVGEIQLSVDGTTVTPVSVRNVTRAAAENLAYPRVQAVKQITDAALAAANQIGDAPVGTISDDITTAFTGGSYGPDGYTGGTRDDRANESTLGNLVADALHATPIAGQVAPDLAVVNPGGLRGELMYEPDLTASPQDGPGVVTFEEANAVLPFVNNISYVTLSGRSLRKIFEQQWQRDKDGNVPSRPFLQLGVSRNVHVTLDETRPEGSRVTGLTINGESVRNARDYVVSTFSFLAAGGDNFWAFKEGVAADTGRIDRELWIDSFFGNGETKSPDFRRRQVYATSPSKVATGTRATVSLRKLNLTSLGSPENTTVQARLLKPGPNVERGTYPVTNGEATATFRVPGTTPVRSRVRMVASPSGTWHQIKVVRATPQMKVRVRPADIEAGQTRPRVIVKMSAEGQSNVRGAIKVMAHGDVFRARLVDGKAVVRLPSYGKAGTKKATVVFLRTRINHRVERVVRFTVG